MVMVWVFRKYPKIYNGNNKASAVNSAEETEYPHTETGNQSLCSQHVQKGAQHKHLHTKPETVKPLEELGENLHHTNAGKICEQEKHKK